MTPKKENDRLDEFIREFREFRDQYEIDMRGDKKLDNGSGGVIGEIRKLKDLWTKYPSLAYLFACRPIQTTAVIVGVYVFLMALYTLGAIKILAGMLGIPVEMP